MFEELQARLGHKFNDLTLLQHALLHRSHAAETASGEDNERLEFLGDAVLQLVVTDHLYLQYPDLSEGTMAKIRAACVNRDELADIAKHLDLGPNLALGRGEEASGGREKASILGDALEAVIAAVYIDAGIEVARTVVLSMWEPLVAERAVEPGKRDYKTRLQEELAARGLRPKYRVTESGPDHAKLFDARLEVEGKPAGAGQGRSKKEAEQAAAAEALETL